MFRYEQAFSTRHYEEFTFSNEGLREQQL